MSITIASKKDFETHIEENDVFEDKVLFIENSAKSYPTIPILIKGKTFNNTFELKAPWCGQFLFQNCFFKEFKVDQKMSLKDISFSECDIKELRIQGRANIEFLSIRKSEKLGSLTIHPSNDCHSVTVYDCPRIRYLSVKGSIQNLRIENRPQYYGDSKKEDRPLNNLATQSIGRISLYLSDINTCQVEWIKTASLILIGPSENTKIRLSKIYCSEFVLRELSPCDAIFYKVDTYFPSNEGSLEIRSSDLTGIRFHNCRLNSNSRILSSSLEHSITLDTHWPIKLSGSKEENTAAFRQLKLLHQNHGSYRKQFDYHKLEMSSFRMAEREELKAQRNGIKSLRSLFNWLGQWFEHMIKVFLPLHVSKFGLVVHRPIMWFLGFQIVFVNLFIYFQGDEINIQHALVSPDEWDFSLFFHILLPTHRWIFDDVVLLEWLDIPWKIIATYLIYHIVISSRKLVKF